jgi:hypothetical protein
MLNKKSALCLWLLMTVVLTTPVYAQGGDDGMGQTIQIRTRFSSFSGRPSWLLIIRDVDNGQNIPYIFDVRRGNNSWVALTYGRNYLITVSNLQFSPYGRNPYKTNPYTTAKINNFCQLESNGRVRRGESLIITIDGDLTPYSNTYRCSVSSYRDTNFVIVNPSNTN